MFPNWSQQVQDAHDARDADIVDALKDKLNALLDDESADAEEIERVCDNLTSHGAFRRAG